MVNNGILLIDKPSGITSHDVVDRIRKITNEKKVGHAGTLDPLATGLLIILVGKQATRLSQKLIGYDKRYLITTALGFTTNTLDTEGIMTDQLDPMSDRIKTAARKFKEAAHSFIGKYEQEVPSFSAVKIGGNKLYDLARKKPEELQKITLPKREVTIYAIETTSSPPTQEGYPQVIIDCTVSSGTYTRALVRDISQKLEIPMVQTALRRIRIGNFDISQAKTLEDVTPSDIIPLSSLQIND
ncbi:tRNA pseudouridine(55) synthase TruB [candidate division WWE3 bacterium]|nr:tRNA pseudouridine(55) synthase TruB [candidate division WWE3 bacterium]